jgi:hypothetical protein
LDLRAERGEQVLANGIANLMLLNGGQPGYFAPGFMPGLGRF